MTNLTELGLKYGTDKSENGYTKIYENFLSDKRDAKNNILEIGVWRGASLRMWSEYFPNSLILGMDIPHEMYPESIFPYHDYEQRNNLIQSIENSGLFLGDQANPVHLDTMFEMIDETTGRDSVDIVIDDGSHFQHDIMKSFAHIFPRLTSGGIYIIEDICRLEDLQNGSMWWGHSKEPHHHRPNFRDDSEWLAGDDIDVNNSVDATFQRVINGEDFSSKYMTEEQNKYINEYMDTLYYYGEDDLSCESNIAVIRKK
jgi:hypothetical protein